jgi:hypothetical protein
MGVESRAQWGEDHVTIDGQTGLLLLLIVGTVYTIGTKVKGSKVMVGLLMLHMALCCCID